MEKIYLAIILGMFLLVGIGLVSAEQQSLGTFKQGSVGDCIELVQTNGNCTYNNISTVYKTGEDSEMFVINSKMTRDDTVYNYSFCNITKLGVYNVHGFGDPDGEKTSWTYDFEVTPSGSIKIGSGEGLSFIGSLFVMLILSVVFMVGGFKSEKVVAKVSFFSLSTIGFIMTILFIVVSAQQNLYGFTGLVTGVETFWSVMKILVGIGILALFIIIALIIKKAWKIKRGYT